MDAVSAVVNWEKSVVINVKLFVIQESHVLTLHVMQKYEFTANAATDGLMFNASLIQIVLQ